MLAAALAIASFAVGTGPAQAGTPIQIGQLSPGEPAGCGADVSLVQSTVAAAPFYTVPSDGVITNWSHKGRAATPGSGRLQVWRPAGGTTYTLVGRSEVKVFSDGVNDFSINLPVAAGDMLGFRTSSINTGCFFFSDTGNAVRNTGVSTDPEPGQTQDFSAGTAVARLNVSATLDPADPPPPPPASLDSSATKGRQSADKLRIKVTADQDSTLDVEGKGKVPKRKSAQASAKLKRFKLKEKTGIALQAGVKKVIRLRFKQNNKTVKRIRKLQKQSKKARKRSKVIANLTATSTAGAVSNSKVKIKLKP